MRRFITLAIFSLIPLLCEASFSGFPLTAGTNYSWYTINAQYAPLAQLYSGIVERCSVVSVAPPSWTNTIYVDNATGGVYQLTITNAIGPVAYSNGTAYPPVTASMLAALDSTIEALIPQFATTSAYATVDANYGKYSMPELFASAGVGLVWTNVATVGTNAITNIVARWTRSPERRWHETLVEMHALTNGDWSAISAQPVEWIHAGNTNAQGTSAVVSAVYYPVVTYGPTSSAWSVSLAGLDVYGSNRTETVAAGDQCTVPWHSITGTPVVSAVSGSLTGAWYCVQYTNDIVVYGDRPYRLYASDLDERYTVLRMLTRTSMASAATYTNWQGFGFDSLYAGWTDAKADAESSWAGNSVSGGAYMWNRMWQSTGYPVYNYAELYAGGSKYYVTAVSTNIPKSVEFYVHLRFDTNLYVIAGRDNQIEHDDFSTGYTTGVWQRVATTSVGTNANVAATNWFPVEPGTVLPLPWVAEPPARSPGDPYQNYMRTFGQPSIYGEKALIDWQFEYR